MASFNKVILIGNLTRDVQIKYTPSNAAVAEIGMAMTRKYKAGSEWKEETTFVDVTLWGRTAEVVAEYCSKGSPLMVEGRLQLDTWKDKDSGQNRSKLRVVGENIQLLGSKGEKQDHPRETRDPANSRQSYDSGHDGDVPF